MKKIVQGVLSSLQLKDGAALVAGLLMPFAFAPYNLPYLAFPLLAVFVYLLLDQTNGRSFFRGWLFGLGQFVVSFSWIFHSIHTYGNAPAALAVVLIILLAAYCALYPALAAYLSQRFFGDKPRLFLLLALPLMWALAEWLRGYVLTGFPWLSLGISQTDTSFAFYAPVIGALGISAVMMLVAGLIVLMIVESEKVKPYLLSVISILMMGQLLSLINWSSPVGDALKISIPQLSITQDQKWRAVNKKSSMQWYFDQSAQHKDSDVIVWPETAIPSFLNRVEPYWNRVKKLAESSSTDVVAGVFMRNAETGRYYNSMVSTNGDYYQKKHLVPLGEYMPFRSVFAFIRNYIHFPMSNIANGADDQPLMTVAGYKAGVSICFEDVFDREIRQALPEAAFLINASNDGWFKVTAEPFQHHQIARMRSIETSRYMIRATNTGVSSIIGSKGENIVTSKMYDRTTISGEMVPLTGSTLYALLGNTPLIILSLIVLVWQIVQRRNRSN